MPVLVCVAGAMPRTSRTEPPSPTARRGISCTREEGEGTPEQAASGTESSAIYTPDGKVAMTLLAREVGPFKLDEVRRKHVRAMP